MADPQIPGVVRVQCITHSLTNLPEDDMVNSWAVGLPSLPGSIDLAPLLDRFGTFYNSINAYRASTKIKTTMTLKMYALSEPPPRQPIEGQFTIAPTAGTPLPNEVAIVLSMIGERNLPRQRGRVYLGPLGSSTMATLEGRTHVIPACRTNIAAAAASLMNGLAADGLALGIVSQRNLNFVPVLGGWVDDAFDTQRRRGTDPLVRTTWGSLL